MIRKILAVISALIILGATFTSVVYADKNISTFGRKERRNASTREINTTEVWSDETILLNESLIIVNGGHLTLDNVNLIMDCTYDNELVIRVEQWGILHIINGSSITANNTNWHYSFEVYGDLIIDQSKVSYVGGSHPASGIQIYTPPWGQATISNSVISNCNGPGIYCLNATPSISGCTITSNQGDGIYLKESTQYNESMGNISMELFFKEGWNTISLPIIPENTSVEVLFGGLPFYALYTWDSQGFSYKKLNETDQLEIGRGYMLYVMEDTILPLTGAPVFNYTMDLSKGWEMMGSVIFDASIAEPDDTPDGAVANWTFTMDFTKNFTITQDIRPGKGYWINVTDDTTFTLESGIKSPIIKENMISLNDGDGIFCNASNPLMENNRIFSNDGNGLECVASSLNITNFYLFNNSEYELLLSTDSHINALNSGFNKDNVQINDTSELIVNMSLSLRTIDEDDNNVSGASVIIERKDGTEVFNGLTDINGLVSPQILTQYINDSTSMEFHTPHTIIVENNSIENRVNVVMDAPKDITIYVGGDSDLDTIPDNVENKDNIYWFEAEHHVYDETQMLRDGFTSNQLTAGSRHDLGEIFNETFLPIPDGTYKYYVRARCNTTVDNAMLQLFAYNDTASLISNDNHLLIKRYRWYSTPEFTTSGMIKLGVKDLTSDASVYVDKVLLACMDSNFGQITDPLGFDTDIDCLFDGLEVRNETFWWEAEDFPYTDYTQQCLDDVDASNAKALSCIDGTDLGVFNVSVELDASKGKGFGKGEEEMDQFQEICESCEHVGPTYSDSWQQFFPTADSLTRVEVKIARSLEYPPNQFPIFMTIEKPLGNVLTEKMLDWWEVPELPLGETEWISFDVPDIALTPDESHYIRLETVMDQLAYHWCYASGDLYPQGESSLEPDQDWTFRTFYTPGEEPEPEPDYKCYIRAKNTPPPLVFEDDFDDDWWDDNWDPIMGCDPGYITEVDGILKVNGFDAPYEAGVFLPMDPLQYPDYVIEGTMRWEEFHFSQDGFSRINLKFYDWPVVSMELRVFAQDEDKLYVCAEASVYNNVGGKINSSDEVWSVGRDSINPTSWYTYRLEKLENEIKVYINDTLILDAKVAEGEMVLDANRIELTASGVYAEYNKVAFLKKQNGKLDVYGDGSTLGTITTSDWYEWYDLGCNIDASGTYHLIGFDNSTDIPGVLVDKVMITNTSEMFIDTFADDTTEQELTFVTGDGEVNTTEIKLPADGIVTSAVMDIMGTSAEIMVAGGLLHQHSPLIFEDKLVYKESLWCDYDVWMPTDLLVKNLTTGATLFLRDSIFGEEYIISNVSIYGDRIAWSEYNISESNWDIYVYSLSLGDFEYISLMPGDELHPDIYEDRMVWQDDSGGDWDIYMYDFITEIKTQIPSPALPTPPPPGDQVNPRIYGDRIVWQDNRNGNWDIYVYDLSSAAEIIAQARQMEIERQIASTLNPEIYPDIYGDKIIWVETVSPVSKYIHLYELTTGVDRILCDSATEPRIYGDKIVWSNRTDPDHNIMVYDLSSDTIEKITSYEYPFEARTPHIHGDKIVWECFDNTPGSVICGDIYLLAQHYTLDVGDDGDIEWERTELFLEPDTTLNLAWEINEYLRTHQEDAVGGFITIPLTFTSEYPGVLHLTNLTIEIEFLTDPLDHDTDGDDLWDGDEIFGFYGYDILEVEDAVEIQAWKHSPLNFIHQTGVTLTTSNGYEDDDTPGTENSLVKLRYHIDDTAQYKLKIQPNLEIKEIINVKNIRRIEHSKGDSPQPAQTVGPDVDRIDGTDIRLNKTLAEYAIKVLVNATYIKVEREGGDEVDVVDDSFEEYAYIETIKLGPRTGIDDKNAFILGWWYFEATYNFTRNTDYKITIGIDLDKIPPDLLPSKGDGCPDNLPFEDISLVQIIDLDFIRIERERLNPLSIDADDDTLLDGFEAKPWYYPLNPDCDGDGISDSVEMYGTGTDPFYRDTDLDGIRDAVELGYTPGRIAAIKGEVSSSGSWTERIAHWLTPYDYTPINNWDAEWPGTINITDPFDFDTDDDGLPDGWTDGWTYESTPIKPVDLRTYDTNNQRFKDVDYWRYDVNNWGQSGEVDIIVQIYEGEDLNLDGSCGGYLDPSDWGFYFDSFGPLVSGGLGVPLTVLGETNPGNADSDINITTGKVTGDDMPDGYEVWFSHIEPYKYGDIFLLNPVDPNDKYDDFDAEQTKNQGYEVVGDWHEISKYTLAYAQNISIPANQAPPIQIPEPMYIPSEIEVELNVDYYDTPMQLELWAADPVTGKPATYDEKYMLDGPILLTGGKQGLYRFDITDNALFERIPNMLPPQYYGYNSTSNQFEFFIVMHYVEPGDPTDEDAHDRSTYYWEGMYEDANTYMKEEDGSWTHSGVAFNYIIYSYDFSPGAVGDNLTNIDEYIVGTNPKNKNSDMIRLEPDTEFNDNLTDGEEVGYDPGENISGYAEPVGGVIYRTNVVDGAITFDNYGGTSDWINYDGDGSGYWGGRNFSYDNVKENPLTIDGCANPDNILLFILEDGTAIYLNRSTHNELYIWSPDSDLNSAYEDDAGVMRYHGTVYIYTYYSTVDMTGYGPNLGYRNQELYLASPFDYDSDDDSIPDGHEIKWNQSCERDKSDALIETDTLINARDRDSDDDGLWDIFEKGWMIDVDNIFDTDDFENMIDHDSDNDGIWDGNESSWAYDTDNDGQTIAVDHYGIRYLYNSGINMLDADSDNDGLVDGFVDGYVWNPITDNFTLYADFGNGSQYGPETSGFDPWEGEDTNQSGYYDFGYEPSPTRRDTDNDRLWDGYDKGNKFGELSTHNEYQIGPTDQLDRDTDNDSVLDGDEAYGWDITVEYINSTYPYLNSTREKIHVTSNPLVNDTDDDDILDHIEYRWINASNPDTDDDGLDDGEEDANLNGTIEKKYGDTNPLDQDCDNDGLLDKHETNTGVYVDELDTGTDPWNRDTDEDELLDGEEAQIHTQLTEDYKIVPTNPDTDQDGLLDSIEFTQTNPYIGTVPVKNVNSGIETLTYYALADPNDYDTDGDYLYDGAEPDWRVDIEEDGKICVRDENSNTFGGEPDDYDQTYVVFRTNATDIDDDDKIDYNPNTWIAVDPNGAVITKFEDYPLELDCYLFDESGIQSIDGSEIFIGYPIGEDTTEDKAVWTPEKYQIFVNSDETIIYIEIAENNYTKYIKSSTTDYEDSIYSQPKADNETPNFVVNHQETYDAREATDLDPDWDDLSTPAENESNTNAYDADTDDDGIYDGLEIEYNLNATDPDTDNDGVTDGTELGITELVERTGYGGTSTSATFNGSSDGRKNFTADIDPTTTTDPLIKDTDSDGLFDGWDDVNENGVLDEEEEAKGEDLNYNGIVNTSEPDPNDADTDDDGVMDGDVHERHLDSDNDGTINALEWDSDDDGIYDGTELGVTSPLADTNVSAGHFIVDEDPNNTTNPNDNDTDNDGLLDGEEDTDCNGAINVGETDPNNKDTDGDGLWDGYDIGDDLGELTIHDLDDLDPGDGEVLWQNMPTDPLNPDSDGDGLLDGDELSQVDWYTISSAGADDTCIIQTRYTDPSLPDSDGDGLSDGIEVEGWTVTIIRQKNKVIEENRSVQSNPTVQDTEGDDLNDYDEYANFSDPEREDTDGDLILDRDEDPGGHSQIEGEDPVLVKKYNNKNINIKIDLESPKPLENKWGGIVIRVTVTARDNAGLTKIVIDVTGQKDKVFHLENEKEKEVTAKFSAGWDLRNAILDGWDVTATAHDYNNNGAKGKKHIDSLAQGISKVLMSAWNALVEAIKSLIESMFNWIWEVIEGMIDRVVQPILDAIQNFVDTIGNKVRNGYENAGLIGAFVGLVDAIFTSPVYWTLLAIITTLLAIDILIKVVTLGTSTALGAQAINVIKPIITSALIAGLSRGASEAFDRYGDEIRSFFTGFGIPLTIIGVASFVYDSFVDRETSKPAEFVGFIQGIIGIILVICDISFGLTIDPVINLILDMVGLFCAIDGAMRAYKSYLDKGFWSLALGDIISFISLASTLISMGLKDYSDAVEQIQELFDGEEKRTFLGGRSPDSGDILWDVRLSTVSSARGKDWAKFGVAEGATTGLDIPLDEPEPPTPPFYPCAQVYFWYPEEGIPLVNVSYIENSSSLRWPLGIYVDVSNDTETVADIMVEWNINDVDTVPGEYYLYFHTSDEDINMREVENYLFSVPTGFYHFNITAIIDTTPPEISNISDNPDPQIMDGFVNISCNVTDDFGLEMVNVNITGPPGFTPVNTTMSDSYYYNTTYDTPGTYEYFIWTIDINNNSNTSDIYTFVIINNPPYTPGNPDPENGALDIPIDTTLNWTGGDLDPGDTVTYDVYFGNVSLPPQVVWNQTETEYTPEILEYNTTYYWQIVSWDNHNASTPGPIWSFTIEEELNEPPNIPNLPSGPEIVYVGVEYTYATNTTDSDGDQIYYMWDWGDGNFSSWLGLYDSGAICEAPYTWQHNGTYDVRVKAKDSHDDESGWSEILTIFVLDGFYLNLQDFPMYLAENIDEYTINQMCGPATIQMNLDYMWWNSSVDPTGPPTWCNDSGWNQTNLFDHGQENNSNISLPYLDATGLRYMIQNLDPPYAEYGYNFAVYHDEDSSVMLKKICLWINYTAGKKPGHPVHVPGAVPVYGNYSNWLSVRGIHTDVPAYPLPEQLEVRGFWVNDPLPGGIGTNSYKMVSDWISTYYLPIDVEDDPYDDEYVAICEPPPSGDCSITLKESNEYWDLEPPGGKRKGGSSWLTQVSDNMVIYAAEQGVREQLLPYDDDFAEVFEQTYPSRPMLIKNLCEEKHDYYAVPFNNVPTLQAQKITGHSPPEEDITLVVVLVDATNGRFKEASWVHDPVDYLPLSGNDALDVVFDWLRDHGINPDELNVREIKTSLVYRGSTPYYPDWRVVISELGMEFFVGQDGTISHDM